MHTDILTLLNTLSEAGIWIHLSDDEILTIGPDAAVANHPDLLAALRQHKPAVIQAIHAMQGHAFFGRNTDDDRFDHAICLHCNKEVYVVSAPRRLSVHRLADGKTVCPGSEQAQLATAETILTAFIADRCIPRPAALLTWTSLRAALFAWCTARELWLPPPKYLQQWLQEHYGESSLAQKHPLVPVYVGLTLTQEEWLGDQATDASATPAAVALKAVDAVRKKTTLVAKGVTKAAVEQKELL